MVALKSAFLDITSSRSMQGKPPKNQRPQFLPFEEP